jgi:probable rRNA maturation factor
VSESPLTISFESDDLNIIESSPLHELCQKVYLGENLDFERYVDIVICGEEMIKCLNRDYRKINEVTDVLSFSFNDDDYLGEIYICLPYADKNRYYYNFGINEEVQRLFVHGLYHLLGYDHETDDEMDFLDKFEYKYIDFDKE